jgi:hypothetical protein
MRQPSIQSRLLFTGLGFLAVPGVSFIVMFITARPNWEVDIGDRFQWLQLDLLCAGVAAVFMLAGGAVFLYHRITSNKPHNV